MKFQMWKLLRSSSVLAVKCEPSLKDASAEQRYQFERVGYFTLDKDSQLSANNSQLIFNRTITLKDTWAKEVNK